VDVLPQAKAVRVGRQVPAAKLVVVARQVVARQVLAHISPEVELAASAGGELVVCMLLAVLAPLQESVLESGPS
jgi:hypothetical protein